MPDVKHKFASAIGDGGDATLVRPSNWNDLHVWPNAVDQGALTLADGQFELQLNRLQVSSTNRLTLQGTARIALFGYTDTTIYNVVGFPMVPSSPFRVPSGWQYIEQDRLTIQREVRAVLEGSTVISDDFEARSRIVLAGRG